MTAMATTRDAHVEMVTNSILNAFDVELGAIRMDRWIERFDQDPVRRERTWRNLMDAVNAVESGLLRIEAFARGDR